MSSAPTEGPPEPGAERAGVEVTMPETGTADGAELISWLKRPGSPIEEDEPICLVRVGDLNAEIVSPATGVVGAIYAASGTRVPPGASLAEILPDPLETLAAEIAELVPADPEPEPDLEPVAAGLPFVPRSAPRPVDLRSFHSPAVRTLAAQHAVDLSRVRGSGRDGRVTRDDVLAAAVRRPNG